MVNPVELFPQAYKSGRGYDWENYCWYAWSAFSRCRHYGNCEHAYSHQQVRSLHQYYVPEPYVAMIIKGNFSLRMNTVLNNHRPTDTLTLSCGSGYYPSMPASGGEVSNSTLGSLSVTYTAAYVPQRRGGIWFYRTKKESDKKCFSITPPVCSCFYIGHYFHTDVHTIWHDYFVTHNFKPGHGQINGIHNIAGCAYGPEYKVFYIPKISE